MGLDKLLETRRITKEDIKHRDGIHRTGHETFAEAVDASCPSQQVRQQLDGRCT
jgi:hypothetical protein